MFAIRSLSVVITNANRRSLLASHIHWLSSTTINDSSSDDNDDFLTGTVKFYDRKNAYGFIVPDNPIATGSAALEEEAIWVHRTSIDTTFSSYPTRPYLYHGERVKFRVQFLEEETPTATNLTFENGLEVALFRKQSYHYSATTNDDERQRLDEFVSLESIIKEEHQGRLDEKEQLEKIKTVVNWKDGYGWTPLHEACTYGHLDLVKLLLMENGGANDDKVNTKAKNGETPFYCAYINNHAEIMKLLAKNGADLNAQVMNPGGYTPLHLACWNDDLEMVRFLVDSGADVNSKDIEGWTPLYYSCDNWYPSEIGKLLIAHGADVNAKANNGETALHGVTGRFGNLEIAKWLIDNGADVNAKDKLDGLTPLQMACAGGYLGMVRLLFKIDGADVDAKEENDGSAEWKDPAYRWDHLKVVKSLIESGAEVNTNASTSNENGEYGEEKPLYQAACRKESLLLKAKLLIKNGVKVNAKTNNGMTAPLLQPHHEDFQVAKLLIENGADVNSKDKYGWWTPLHRACVLGNLEVIKLMIENGADVNAKRKNGKTPLHHASWYNCPPEIVKFMIENGAEVNAKDGGGKTPLDYAYEEEMINLLIENGAE